jgi:putative transposase
MKIQRTVKLKLLPSEEQAELLQRTMETYCNALNYISQVAHGLGNCRNYLTLHRSVYYEVRERFGLKSQQTISAERQVAAAYKTMKANGNEQGKASFNFRGGLLLQQGRDYGLKVEQGVVGITTLAGRQPIAFSCGDFQRQHFDWGMGSATLVKRRGVFWLHVVFWREVEEAAEEAAETVIGVDRGMNYLAVTRAPDGGTVFHGGGPVKQRKHHYRRVRASLQATHALARSASEGTKGAKRTLKRLSGREKRYQRAVNHVVSKEIAAFAASYPQPVIVLEELGGIRQRAKQRKAQRGDFHSWALPLAYQLAQFVEYKAAASSIPVVYVDPRGTSQSCSSCGAKGTRRRHDFSCSCGYLDHADRNAASNIAQRYVDRRQAELAGDGAWSTAPEIASGESRLAGGVIPV